MIDLPWVRLSASSMTRAIGRVDHQRHFDFLDQLLEEARSGRRFRRGRDPAGRRPAMCAPRRTCRRPTSAASSNLPWPISRLNLRLPSTLVRSPTIDRPRAVVDHQRLDSARPPSAAAVRNPRRCCPSTICASSADMLGRGPAASADQVDPSLLDEALDFRGQHLRRFVVMPLLVGQSRVGHAGDREAADFRQRAQMIGHEIGAGGAVQPHPQQIAMRERGVKRLDILAGQQRAHRFDRA